MSSDKPFTKDNLNDCLRELAKEFRKLNGTKMPAEVILIGGASVLANYGFRGITYDIDAIIMASSAMKQAVNNVGDRLGLPTGWLNMDFQKTKSFSRRLPEFSVYYKTFSGILTVRTITAEYLIAMKLMSGRLYKYDLSDVAGILLEHEKMDKPITREMIDKAVARLYGDAATIPEAAQEFITQAFSSGAYEQVYKEIREREKQNKETLLELDKKYPGLLKEDNLSKLITQAREKKQRSNNDDMER
jgi:hypothetical protein